MIEHLSNMDYHEFGMIGLEKEERISVSSNIKLDSTTMQSTQIKSVVSWVNPSNPPKN